MALNNTTAVGSDQKWKAEVEKEIESLKAQVAVLKSQVKTLGKR
jgi:chaperonin cofactor prefoldin